jgi:hypothetical protein
MEDGDQDQMLEFAEGLAHQRVPPQAHHAPGPSTLIKDRSSRLANRAPRSAIWSPFNVDGP